jgi:CRISPR/Cas system-associated endonuclease/helicase Cas3
MHEVVELRELQTQFVFMTATLPPSMQSEFSDSVLL